MTEQLTRETALASAMEHITAAIVALDAMEAPEYIQDAHTVEAWQRGLKLWRSTIGSFATCTYPAAGYMVRQFGDGRWVPFRMGRLAKSAGGGPCWSTLADPDSPGRSAEYATREAAEALCLRAARRV